MKNILLFLLPAFFFACESKDNPNAVPCTNDKPVADFDKITRTDAMGTRLSVEDQTDWTYDKSWTCTETGLFSISDGETSDTILPDSINVTAYPNPLQKILALSIYSPKSCLMKFAIVNKNFGVVFKTSVKCRGGREQLNLDLASAMSPGNYRLYYAFYIKDHPMFYKGHGDIRLE